MTPVELLLSKLPDAKRNGRGWQARCPAHDDLHPSLSIAEGDDGRALVNCHAGCSLEAVVSALGLTMDDLFPPKDGHPGRALKRKPKTGKPTGKTYPTPEAAAKALAQALGGELAESWSYSDGLNREVMRVLRFHCKDGKRYRPIHPVEDGWRVGDPSGKLPLYRLPELNGVQTVYLCEGEKAADAARSLGLIATTTAHGAKAAEKSDLTPLRGKDVVILPDHDEPGRAYAETIASALTRMDCQTTARIVPLPDLPQGGDIVEFIEDRKAKGHDNEAIRAEVEALADAAEPASAVPSKRPHLIRMSDVTPTEIDWLWSGRIPLGRMTLLVGRPGAGKSFFAAYLAANVSLGRDWIDGSPCPRGSVVLISAEDDPGDTVAPRLIAHGADLERIFLLTGVTSRTDEGQEVQRAFRLADLDLLRHTLERHRDCKLIVVDPIGSYLGGRTDAHRDNEVRSILAPVCQLAAEYGVALVVIAHTRKSSAEYADDMALGSRAFTGMARSVLHLMTDPDDESGQRRLLLPGKNNLAERAPGLAFDIGPGDIEDRPCVHWLPGEVDITADEAVNRRPRSDDDRRSERDEAADFLRRVLADGPMPAKAVREMARESEGIAPRTLDRAKKTVGIEAYRPKNPGPWWWRLVDTEAERQTSKDDQGGALAFCPGATVNGDFEGQSGDTLPERQPWEVWRSAHDEGASDRITRRRVRDQAAALFRKVRKYDRDLAGTMRDAWRERVAICTMEGGMSEQEAEKVALAELEAYGVMNTVNTDEKGI